MLMRVHYACLVVFVCVTLCRSQDAVGQDINAANEKIQNMINSIKSGSGSDLQGKTVGDFATNNGLIIEPFPIDPVPPIIPVPIPIDLCIKNLNNCFAGFKGCRKMCSTELGGFCPSMCWMLFDRCVENACPNFGNFF